MLPGLGRCQSRAKQTSDFRRQHPFVARYPAHRIPDATLGLAETVIGRRIDIANPRCPGCAYDGFSLLTANLDANPRVCFEIDAPSDVFAYGRYECDTGLAYQSVIAFGTVRLVDEPAEKTRFCVELMRKYADPSWQRPKAFFPRLGDITVWALAIERLTGKEQALPAASQRWPAMDRTKSPGAIPPPPLR